MQKTLFSGMFLALATLSAAHAQVADTVTQGPSSVSPSREPAPIVRAYLGNSAPDARRDSARVFQSQPSAGIFVRNDTNDGVQTVSSSTAATELRVTAGRANVTLHHPSNNSEILVDLPGGQVSLLKDGVYTFNATTNTVRVLHGEAEVFSGAKTTKGTKVKEAQELSFFPNAKLKAIDAYPNELGADLLSNGDQARSYTGGYRGYGEGFYGGGYGYGYPYYAGLYDYPFGYGFGPYGYGYGYPFGVGIGFGYYGGFRGYYSGFRGGYGGGFGGFRGGFGRR